MGLTDVRTQIHVCFEEMKGEDNLKGEFRIHIASFKMPNLNLVFVCRDNLKMFSSHRTSDCSKCGS